MRLDKIAIYIVVAAFLSFLVSLVMPAKPQPIINGYVDKTKIDGRKLYEKTLINSYNPQTSWTANRLEPIISRKSRDMRHFWWI